MCATLVLFFAGTASASGYYAARFGGAASAPTSVHPTSLYYNPGAIGRLQGTQIHLDVSWIYRSATFNRAESAVSPNDDDTSIAANTGEGSVSNFIYSPALFVASDFGTGAPFSVAAGFFVPFGGQAVWSQVDAVDGAPAGAVDGPQRWHTIDGTIRTIGLGLGAGYHIESSNLSLGLSFNTYLSEISTLRARNGDGTDDLFDTDGSLKEGRSWADVSSMDFGIGLGFLWSTTNDRFSVGLGWQSAPNFGRDIEFEGELSNLLAIDEQRAITDVYFYQSMPHLVNWGLAYRFVKPGTTHVTNDHGEVEMIEIEVPKMELRLSGNILTWNKLDNQCLVNQNPSGGSVPYDLCQFEENGGHANPDNPDRSAVLQNFIREWNVGWSIKVGGSYYFSDRLELNLGVGFDSNSVPDHTLDPALFDMPKMIFELGAVVGLTDWLDFGLTISEILYFERDNSDSDSYFSFDPPSRQPDSTGVYNQNILVANTNFLFHF